MGHEAFGVVARHVANGQRIVGRQRHLVEMLGIKGCSTTAAKRTLNVFLETLAIFEEELKKMERERSGTASSHSKSL